MRRGERIGQAVAISLGLLGCEPAPVVSTVSVPSAAPSSDAVPVPSFDRIDYAHPERYLDLPPTLGSRELIERTAASLKGDTTRDKLRAIYDWREQNVRYREEDAASSTYHWRNFDQLVADKTHGGCADEAILFGAVARAKGIPTVWVKSLDTDWIREFKRTGKGGAWNGHVFLEIFVDGEWKLLDASQLKLYDHYDPRTRILPGPRFAYDKGGDPWELVLSSRWEPWKRQTTEYLKNFDLAQLPVTGGTDLVRGCFVVENGAAADKIFRAQCESRGMHPVRTFNVEFDTYLPRAKGQLLIVTMVDGKSALPDERWQAEILIDRQEVARKSDGGQAGVLCKDRPDGTHVLVVYGKDDAALKEQAEKTDLLAACSP